MKKGMLHLDPAWANFALSLFKLLIEILCKGVLLKLFIHYFSFIQCSWALLTLVLDCSFDLCPFDLHSFVLHPIILRSLVLHSYVGEPQNLSPKMSYTFPLKCISNEKIFDILLEKPILHSKKAFLLTKKIN